MLTSENFRPRLACEVQIQGGEISLVQNGLEMVLDPDGSSFEELRSFLDHIDGKQTIGDIQQKLDASQHHRFGTLLEDLDRHRLLDDAGSTRMRSGSEALLKLEDYTNTLLEERYYGNVYWSNVLKNPEKCPPGAFYGLAIENYHFLFRESMFDSPVLPYLSNNRVRLLMNEFYVEEYGHDEIIVKSLLSLGITRDDIRDMLPLPETLALCNALAYWGATDPLFFFSTLGVLEGKNPEKDHWIEACEKAGLSPAFIKPMRAHSDINRKGEHGNLTRLIFAEIQAIGDETLARMQRQMRIFVEMYNDFYCAIWNFYSPIKDIGAALVRRLSAI
ncbi:MAG: iron-containing redox enzyme family protein [Proteobacteria bacterium]|nr:iron-containing redox enzyme family protein [Pseudomonadota bacterium]